MDLCISYQKVIVLLNYLANGNPNSFSGRKLTQWLAQSSKQKQRKEEMKTNSKTVKQRCNIYKGNTFADKAVIFTGSFNLENILHLNKASQRHGFTNFSQKVYVLHWIL